MAPSLLQQVLQGLASAVLDAPDALTFSDALWLAPLLPLPVEEENHQSELDLEQPPDPAAGTFDPIDGSSQLDRSDSKHGEANPEPPPGTTITTTVNAPRDASPSVSQPAPSAALLPQVALPRESDARALLPVWLEDPPLLVDSLAFLRALAPLQAEQVQGPRLRLDEEATVEAFVASCGPDGRGGCWRPVLVPIPEPRYELVLVIDGAPMMALWQRLVLDLQRALASCAVVRQLHVVKLASDGSVPTRQRRWCQPLPEGRRLFLLLSDCCGDAWWSGEMAERLAEWGKPESQAILQVLPSWMWPQTALGLGDELVLTNAGTSAHVRWKAERQRWLSDEPAWLDVAPAERARISTTAAVLRCEPEAIAVWSDLLTARPRRSCAGVLLAKVEALSRPVRADQDLAVELEGADQTLSPASEVDAELDRLAAFQAMATPRARQLLQLLAAAPVLTLPVIRLVRQALLFGDRTPLATAEVLLGGVLQLKDNPCQGADAEGMPETWQFTMAPQVREQLLSGIEDMDAGIVFNAVTRLVEERWNQFMPRGSFRAFLTDPYQQAPPELAGIESFANVAAHVLEQLGGDYAALASQLRDGAHKAMVEPWPATEYSFEEMELETGVLHPAGFPPLEIVDVETTQIQLEKLEPLRFTTATLSPFSRFGFRRIGESWSKLIISRRQESTWCFRQPLGPVDDDADAFAVQLTLVQIPEGSFQMGSPRKESKRSADEGPQHEVTIASFFMSQTAITQAQWRQVAGWRERPGERWGRELEPEPSFFQPRANPKARSFGMGSFSLLEGESNSDQRPVDNVSWLDASEFCNRLSQRTGRYYTLPSEAQWEYSCRAGTTTPFHFGATITPDLANYDGTSTYADGPKGEYRQQPTPVGMFPANAWGLHDMHGNVWEWCVDQWHDSYAGASMDGGAWVNMPELNKAVIKKERSDTVSEKESRLLRGGSWSYDPGYCRSACRNHSRPGDAYGSVGFRVVCLPQGPSLNS
jgi:formylglycine-generating enzyme required for sulfatase activity